MNREFLNADGELDFAKFDQMNGVIKRFLVTLPTQRINNQTASCLVPDSKVKQLFKSMKGNANGMCGGGNMPLGIMILLQMKLLKLGLLFWSRESILWHC